MAMNSQEVSIIQCISQSSLWDKVQPPF